MNTIASLTATDTLWMLVCACFVFFMQAEFTCYEAGLVQSKNDVVNVIPVHLTGGLTGIFSLPFCITKKLIIYSHQYI